MAQKISELVEKINFMTRLSTFPNLNRLEVELLMQHLHELHTEMDNILRSMSDDKQKSADFQQTIVTERMKEFVHKPAEEVVITQEDFESEELISIEEKSNDPISVAKSTTTKTINESTEVSSSLNEKLKPSTAEIHHKLSSRPLKDLIDFNMRFAIVNDLFKGKSDVFNQVVNRLDSVQNYSEAKSVLQSEMGEILSLHSPSAMLFEQLVKQRFGEL